MVPFRLPGVLVYCCFHRNQKFGLLRWFAQVWALIDVAPTYFAFDVCNFWGHVWWPWILRYRFGIIYILVFPHPYTLDPLINNQTNDLFQTPVNSNLLFIFYFHSGFDDDGNDDDISVHASSSARSYPVEESTHTHAMRVNKHAYAYARTRSLYTRSQNCSGVHRDSTLCTRCHRDLGFDKGVDLYTCTKRNARVDMCISSNIVKASREEIPTLRRVADGTRLLLLWCATPKLNCALKRVPHRLKTNTTLQ
jgi:hypothetical protein